MAINQVYLFIVFTITGIIIGILFDLFRVLRKIVRTKDLITSLEDIMFWILTGLITVYVMYKYCDGELRLFMIIGVIFGTAIYMCTISRYIIKFLVKTINIIIKLVGYPIIIIYNFIKNIICRHIFLKCINLRKIIKNVIKKGGFF